MRVHHGHIRIEGRHQLDFLAGERACDHLAGAVPEGIRAQHVAHRHKGDILGGGLQAGRQGVVGPFGHLDRARLQVAAGALGEPPGLQPHHVSHIQAVVDLARAQDLHVVRGRVTGEAHIFPPLADNFVAGGDRGAVGAESADRQVVAVVHEPGHSLGQVHDLVHGPARFGAKKRAGRIRIRVRKKGPLSLFNRHHARLSLAFVRWFKRPPGPAL